MKAIDPYRCVKSALKADADRIRIGDTTIVLQERSRINLLSLGKASVPMARAAYDRLRGRSPRVVIVCPEDTPRLEFSNYSPEVFRTSHPIPDQRGMAASERVSKIVEDIGQDELLICLISGGASAMLPATAPEVKLEDLRRVTDLLVKSKSSIHEINTVRRHVSNLKGGLLVRRCRAKTILSLIVSDVPGNHLPDIGSGLTAEDPTTYQDAIQVLSGHELWKVTPERVKRYLKRGVEGAIPDTPKPGDRDFRRVHNVIIADNRTACLGTQRILRSNSIRSMILSSSAEMEADNMGKLLGRIGWQCSTFHEPVSPPSALIVGGETTVDVRGNGMGGRNQQTVLSAVEQIAGQDGTVVAALGTDGIDGNSSSAGAVADGLTCARAISLRVDSAEYLSRNDSYHFFRKLRDNLVTGRTGTNVGDVYLMLCLD